MVSCEWLLPIGVG